MRAMKDSGVEWLGEIPTDWVLKKVSYVSGRSRISATDLEVVTAFRDGQVTLRANRRLDGFTEATQYHGYQRIKPGQVAVHRMDAFAGAIGVSDSDGMCSPVLTLLDCEPILNPRFLALYLREISKSGWIEALAKSVRERTSEFGWSELAAQAVVVPRLEEQNEIVSYLDQETSQIDHLISKKEQLIEKLIERRKVIITQAVTKGLEPNVPMKDSGVEWVGQVPASWGIVPIWTQFRRTKRTGFEGETLLSVYREHGVIPKVSRDDNHNVESEDLSGYQLVEVGDLVVNKMKAWQGSISISKHRGIVSPAYFVFSRESREVDDAFVHFLLRSRPYVQAYSLISKGVRIGQWDLQPELFRKIPLLIPPRNEQTSIGTYLDQENRQIDLLINSARKAIELLLERRQALITQVVTGKLDVRGLADGNS